MSASTTHEKTLWDTMNRVEIPIVKFFQRVFHAEENDKLYEFIAELFSANYISFYPVILYVLGFSNEAATLASGIIVYSLVSSLCKLFLLRKRPYHYGVFSTYIVKSSSFPSRHTIASQIIASVFPSSLVRLLITLVIFINRITKGDHYPTDVFAGVFIGQICVLIVKYVTNRAVIIVIGLIGVNQWQRAARTVGMSIPLLFAPKNKFSNVLFSGSFWIFYLPFD
jgi:membrane-associated phospholipid phosphatase